MTNATYQNTLHKITVVDRMTWFYTARQRFSPHNTQPESWHGYQTFSGFQHIEELVSADAILCADLIEELVDEDWQYNVHADGRVTWFTDLAYLLHRIDFDPTLHNLLALSEDPHATPSPPDGFMHCGYDILDSDDAVSVLTNCGQFPSIFAPSLVNCYGLVPELAVAEQIAETIRSAFPDDYHCLDCHVWEIARYQPATR